MLRLCYATVRMRPRLDSLARGLSLGAAASPAGPLPSLPRRRARRATAAARLLLLCSMPLMSGCIPVPRSVVLQPQGAVVVRDQDSGAPIAAARVLLRRYNLGPPPRRESRRFTANSDASGRALFTLETGHEWVMPLMMHGVPQWAFDVCIAAPGYQARAVAWFVQGMWTADEDRKPRADLLVALRRGPDQDCEQRGDWLHFGSEPLAK